jgi:Fic family protein
VYLAKGARATTAIEGNTLSEEEVLKAVSNELRVPPSKEYLRQEVRNIIAACNLITSRIAQRQEPPITAELLCEYNALVLKDVPVAEEIQPGRIRRHNVGVLGYRGADSRDVHKLTERFCHWLEHDLAPLGGQLGPVMAAILRAIVAHLYVAWIHPFGDGNGRTARLLEFDILLRSGVPSPAAHLLSNHYNATRSEYYRQLDLASKTRNPMGFAEYAIAGFRDGLREQLAKITEQVRDIVWRNYVWELFRDLGSKSQSARRQRHLALDISLQSEGVEKSHVPMLTARQQEDYKGKTMKTASRDINKLIEVGLVVRNGKRYFANREIITPYLPLRRGEPERI